MAVHGGTDIITDGLFFCVDFLDSHCYPGSGTTANDIISGTAGTLYNGASFVDDETKSCVVFDGTNDYFGNGVTVTTAQLSAGYTFELWGLWENIEGGNEDMHGFHTGGSGGRMYLGWYQGKLMSGTGSGYQQITSVTGVDNAWCHMAHTHDGSGNVVTYYNGSSVATASGRSYSLGQSPAPLTFGGYLGGSGHAPSGAHTDGKLACSHWYTRPLTASEILHNFNAKRDRFGI